MRKWKWGLALLATGGVIYFSVPLTLTWVGQHYLPQKIAKNNSGNLTISNLQLKLRRKPIIEAHMVRLESPPWHSRRWVLEAERVTAVIDGSALWNGKLHIETVRLQSPRLFVEKNPQPVPSKRSSTSPNPIILPQWFEIFSAQISNGKITVVNNKKTWEIRIEQGLLTSSGRGASIIYEASGDINQTPIHASAISSSFEAMMAREPTTLEVDGYIGVPANRVHAKGQVADLFKWYQADFALDYSIPQLPVLLPLLSIEKMVDIGAFTGTANFYQQKISTVMQLRDISLQLTEWGSRIELTGEISNLNSLSEMDFRLLMHGDLMQYVSLIVNRELKPLESKFEVAIQGSSNQLHFTLEVAQLENFTVIADASGTATRSDSGWVAKFPVLARLKTADDFGELSDEKHDPFSSIIAAIGGNHLEKMLAQGLLPPINNLQLDTDFIFEYDQLSANVNKVSGEMYGVDWSVTGMVDDLVHIRGVQLEIIGQANSLQRVMVGDINLPESTPVWLRANLVDDISLLDDTSLSDDTSRTFYITDLHATIHDPRFQFEAHGGINFSSSATKTNIDIDIELLSTDPLLSLLTTSEIVMDVITTTLPLQISGNLWSVGGDNWEISNIQAWSLKQSTNSLSGEITSLVPFQGGFRANLGVDSLAKMPILNEFSVPTDHLNLSLKLIEEKEKIVIKNLVASLLLSNSAVYKLRGDTVYMQPLKADDLELSFQSDTLGTLKLLDGGLLDPQIPVIGMAKVDVQQVDEIGEHYQGNVRMLKMTVGSSDIGGDFNWHMTSDQTKPAWTIDANLYSSKINLNELLVSSTTPSKPSTELFSSDHIDTDWLHIVNGDFTLRADSLRSRYFRIQDLNMHSRFENGKLEQTVKGIMGVGKFVSELKLNAQSPELSADWMITGKSLDISSLKELYTQGYVLGGTVDLDMRIIANGESPLELVGNTNGSVLVELNQVKMQGRSLNILGGDIFLNIISASNLFREKQEYVDIECGVFNLVIAKGVLSSREGIAVQSEKVTLLGSGNVNLNDNSVRIIIVPKARKGSGVNPSGLVKWLRVGGSVTNPTVELSASGLLQSTVLLWSSIVSGGWALLVKGLWDRIQANTDVCGLAKQPK